MEFMIAKIIRTNIIASVHPKILKVKQKVEKFVVSTTIGFIFKEKTFISLFLKSVYLNFH